MDNISKIDDKAEQKYLGWNDVVATVSELKYSLNRWLSSAKATRCGSTFTIYADTFLYKKLCSNANDVELVRGVIAQREKLSRDEVIIKITEAVSASSSPFSDLENL